MAKLKKKKKMKAKKRSKGFGKSSIGMEVVSLLGGYIAGNLAGNYTSKLTNAPIAGIAAPLGGIFLAKMMKLKTEKAISSGLIISAVNQVVKSKLLPENEMLKLALSGNETEYYLVDGSQIDPLAGVLPENTDIETEYSISGNSDPLS
jgi:hypothetical protein